MEAESLLVVGGGISGLVAARALAKEGCAVMLLEARCRMGGRICTIRHPECPPIELGAEFIHGCDNKTWEFAREARFTVSEAPDRHWLRRKGVLREQPDFWDQIESVFEHLDVNAPDQSFATFLDSQKKSRPLASVLAREYVEGFNAADAHRISALALAQVHEQSDENTHRNFRLDDGYSKLVEWLETSCRQLGVHLRPGTIVRRVRWKPGSVELHTATDDGPRVFSGPAAVITLPLPLLREKGRGGLDFTPELPRKGEAANALAMGHVVKIVARFHTPFWPRENVGYIHAPEECIPTWWSHPSVPLLTGWVGGPRAERVARLGEQAVQEEAISALAKIFDERPQRLTDLLDRVWFHDWSRDPFALGAYSYTPVGQANAPDLLRESCHDTLFFGGEATADAVEQGTVSGAISSGLEAARQVLQLVSK